MKPDRSVLHSLEEQGKKTPRIDLEGGERSEDPRVRYEIVEEIARGGVGLVYRGRDNDIGRDVALKVLKDELLKEPDLIRRFVEEAQIGGQLQHPGIVPVYELGLRSDARPYFAMKLVKGETLAAKLAERASPADDRRALLTVFRDICRTMAYAHARGVIHRDLKPENVMIGNFGEVQVVDWGFAKVLRRGGVDDEGLRKRTRRAVTLVSTVRTGEKAAESVAGSVMGTPAYMPPEQAMGRVEDLDEKSDIFSLGAILLEILTGTAPYTSENIVERMTAAAKAQLEPALSRLEACDADSELTALCRRCLEPLPKDRPASAETLADVVAACLTREEGRAHQAKIHALRANARADEQRRARRFTTLVGSSVVAVLAIAAAAFLYVDGERAERERGRRAAIEAALQEAARERSAKRWPAAIEAAERAELLGHRGPLGDEIRADAARAKVIATRLAEEKVLLAGLERARAMRGDHYDKEEIDAAYVGAIERLWPDGRVDTTRLARSERARDFAAAFDDWAALRRSLDPEKEWRVVDGWARAIDPEANALRDAMAREDAEELERLLGELDLESVPVARISVLGSALGNLGDKARALEFFRRAQQVYPDEFWINTNAAWAASHVEDHDLLLRYATTALAIRPESLEARHWYGIALNQSGDPAGALEVLQEALRRWPEWTHGYVHVARALDLLDRDEEALAAYRHAIDGEEDDAHLHLSAGIIHYQRGQYEAALTHLERAVELEPDEGVYRNWLASALSRSGRMDRAEVEFRQAIEHFPDDPKNLSANYTSLSDVLRLKGELEEALEYSLRAKELLPDSPQVLNNLALVYSALGDHEKAIRMMERLVELQPDSARALANLASVRMDTIVESRPVDPADLEEVIGLLREAVALDPGRSHPRMKLGHALANARRFGEAVAEHVRAIELAPEGSLQRADSEWGLGEILVLLGHYEAAIPHLVRAIRTLTQSVYVHGALATSYEAVGRVEEAVLMRRREAELDPGRSVNLANLLERLGRYEEALSVWRRALGTAPGEGEARAEALYRLGTALYMTRRIEEAREHLGTAVGLRPDHPGSWCNLGWCLREQGRWEEAAEKFRRGHELGTARGDWGWGSALWLRRTERMVALRPALARILAGEEVDLPPEDRAILAEMLRVEERFDLAMTQYLRAFREAPRLEQYGQRDLYMAIRAAEEGGADHDATALAWFKQYVRGLGRYLRTSPTRVWKVSRNLPIDPWIAPLEARAATSDEWREAWAMLERLGSAAEASMRQGQGGANRPVAGFRVVTPEAGPPICIAGVTANSPAAAAGLRTGDRIVELDGQEIADFPAWLAALGGYGPGDEVTVLIRRGEEEIELHLAFGTYADVFGK